MSLDFISGSINNITYAIYGFGDFVTIVYFSIRHVKTPIMFIFIFIYFESGRGQFTVHCTVEPFCIVDTTTISRNSFKFVDRF